MLLALVWRISSIRAITSEILHPFPHACRLTVTGPGSRCRVHVQGTVKQKGKRPCEPICSFHLLKLSLPTDLFVTSFVCLFLKLLFKNVVDLQCSICFGCTAK